MAATVEIYTWRACPFCVRAKALLDRKGVAYTEFAIDGDEAARSEMAVKSGGRRRVPPPGPTSLTLKPLRCR